MGCSTPGFPVHHQLLEHTQTHVRRVSDAIQPSHPLLRGYHRPPFTYKEIAFFFFFLFLFFSAFSPLSSISLLIWLFLSFSSPFSSYLIGTLCSRQSSFHLTYMIGFISRDGRGEENSLFHRICSVR